MNRHVFKQVGSAWLKEVDVHHAYGGPTSADGSGALSQYATDAMGIRLDLTVFVKRGNAKFGSGLHAFEVKMADDGDAKRRERQLAYATRVANYVWLAVVGKTPTHPDTRYGLIEYDLFADAAKVVRYPQRLPTPPYGYVVLNQYSDWARAARAAVEFGERQSERWLKEKESSKAVRGSAGV